MPRTRTILVRGTEHAGAHEAIQWTHCSGADHAISLGGRFFTVTDQELERLQRACVRVTTWHHHEATGRILSVPGD